MMVFYLQGILFSLGNSSWDTDRASSVCYSSTEIVDRGSFVETSQTSFVILSFIWIISLNMTNVMTGQFVNGLFDFSKSTFISHCKSGEVSVCSSTIPVTRHRFWVHGCNNSEIFSDTVEKEATHP